MWSLFKKIKMYTREMESALATWPVFSPIYWNDVTIKEIITFLTDLRRLQMLGNHQVINKKHVILWTLHWCISSYSNVLFFICIWQFADKVQLNCIARLCSQSCCFLRYLGRLQNPSLLIFPSLLGEKLGLEGGSRPRYTWCSQRKKYHELGSPK